MSGRDFVVPPMSWQAIGDCVGRFRTQLGLGEVSNLPVMELVETILDNRLNLFRLEVCSHADMDGAEGFTDPNGKFLMLREDVYEAAYSDDGRARFTVAHELGHMVLHTGKTLYARAKPTEIYKPYRLSEPQANQFAAELLMPPNFFRRADTVEQVMERHAVSAEAAGNRLDYLRKKGLIKI